MRTYSEKKNCKVVREQKEDGIRYQLVDANGNHWEFTESKLIDDHYVLFKHEDITPKVFGVTDRNNISEMERKLKEEADKIAKEPRSRSDTDYD